MLLNIAYISSFISALIYIIVYFKNYFEINLRYFAGYLFCVFFFEIIASYVPYENGNLLVYHILIFFEFNLLLLFFRDLLESEKSKKIIFKLFIIFNIVNFIANLYYYFSGIYFLEYNVISSNFGAVLIVIALFLYYKEFLASNKILNYKKILSFWIAFGLLLYYVGFIPFTAIINSLKNLSYELKINLFKIAYCLTIIMHSCFIFGALWSQKKVK